MAIIELLEAEEEEPAPSSDESVHYHVFLSFRGPDTRYTFADSLYRQLTVGGYHVFRDDDEIQAGQNIRTKIEKAIQESRISVIVFSEDYASSKWCLDELVVIMKRHREEGHRVLPVFYHVDPSDVRNQRGSFAESFVQHDMDFKDEMDRMEGWRTALREVGGLKGVTFDKKRYELDVLQEIVKMVGNQVRHKILSVVPKLVGRKSDIDHINSWVQDGSKNVCIGTICGIGGIGKTTIAREIYNMNFHMFEGSCFLEDVRETSNQHQGLVHLQAKLLQDLTKTTVNSIFGVSEGRAMIKHVVSYKKVLLILDDVDDMDQYDKLIGKKDWFCSGSKIIITTKSKNIPRAHERDKLFEIRPLRDDESLKLLSLHAFGQDHPRQGYDDCSRNLVHYCDGLPLALQVLGSSMSGKTTKEWQSEIQKLEANPNCKIQDLLRISYDSLPDRHDKKLFLDVACFFIGVYKKYATKILEGCGFSSAAGIRNLMDRCLLTVNDEDKLMMHQLIRDMGRELARQESLDIPGKRRRVCDNEDAIFVLTQNTGTESIRGFILRLPVPNSHSTLLREENCSERRRLNFSFWRSGNDSPTALFSMEAFAKMKYLQLLNLSNVELQGGYKDIPRTLVWLHWHGFSLTYIPNDLCLEKLVVLEMPYSTLRYVWKGIRHLKLLKVLDLRHSLELTRTPNFKGLPSLEILVLEGCINLKEVDASIGDLVRLESLNLKDCKNIRLKLPVLKSLKNLNITGCPNLGNLPGVLMKFKSLKVLNAGGIMSNDFREAKLSWMRSALLCLQLSENYAQSTCLKLDFFPKTLRELSLANCGLSDNLFDVDVSCIPLLKKLDLRGNPITRLPESIKQLQLKLLWLKGCRKLKSVCVVAIPSIDVEGCESLERVETQGSLFLEDPIICCVDCPKLVEVEGYFKLEPLENMDSEVKKHLGLGNIALTACTDQVALFNKVTSLLHVTSTQVSVRESAWHSVFLPGEGEGVDPDWYDHQLSWGEGDNNCISFHLLPVVGHKLIGFSLRIKYCDVTQQRLEKNWHFECPLSLDISNETTGKSLGCTPIVHGVPRSDGEMLTWLSYWRLEELTYVGKEGDEVKLTLGPSTKYVAKEWGIRLIYNQLEEEEEHVLTQAIQRPLAPWFRRLNVCYVYHHVYPQ